MATKTIKTYDAIVVGSGITGGWAAKELGEKGLQTIVLEAGRPVDPDTDYAEHVPEWEVKYRGMGDRRRTAEEQQVQETTGGMDEWNSKFFVNDKQNPYTTEPGKPFLWIRGRQVGGRSIIWGRQSYRWSDLDFEANLREGIGVELATDGKLKRAMEIANKLGARYTLIIGDNEISAGAYALKNMQSGEQQTVTAENIKTSICNQASH